MDDAQVAPEDRLVGLVRRLDGFRRTSPAGHVLRSTHCRRSEAVAEISHFPEAIVRSGVLSLAWSGVSGRAGLGRGLWRHCHRGRSTACQASQEHTTYKRLNSFPWQPVSPRRFQAQYPIPGRGVNLFDRLLAG
jgi:hypothetical protein